LDKINFAKFNLDKQILSFFGLKNLENLENQGFLLILINFDQNH
tara:strand:+ start:362 stop:493 length:132 start_codon:yes stop_codon:yes gene_type:complete